MKKPLSYFILLLLVICSLDSLSQSNKKGPDYLKIKETLNPTGCTPSDSEQLFKIMENYRLFDPSSLGKNLHQFYYDYGMLYYVAGSRQFILKNFEEAFEYWETGAMMFKKSIEIAPEHKQYMSYWNMAMIDSFKNDCHRANENMDMAIKTCKNPKKYLNQPNTIKQVRNCEQEKSTVPF